MKSLFVVSKRPSHITTLMWVCLEEVIQKEANGMEGSHRSTIVNNALSKSLNWRAGFILLHETTKTKKWTMKKTYQMEIYE